MSSMLAVWPFFFISFFFFFVFCFSYYSCFFFCCPGCCFLLLFSHEYRKERGQRLICSKFLINSVALIPNIDRNANIILCDRRYSQWNGIRGECRKIDKNQNKTYPILNDQPKVHFHLLIITSIWMWWQMLDRMSASSEIFRSFQMYGTAFFLPFVVKRWNNLNFAGDIHICHVLIGNERLKIKSIRSIGPLIM